MSRRRKDTRRRPQCMRTACKRPSAIDVAFAGKVKGPMCRPHAHRYVRALAMTGELEVESQGALPPGSSRDAYLRWCAGHSIRPLPWWTEEGRLEAGRLAAADRTAGRARAHLPTCEDVTCDGCLDLPGTTGAPSTVTVIDDPARPGPATKPEGLDEWWDANRDRIPHASTPWPGPVPEGSPGGTGQVAP